VKGLLKGFAVLLVGTSALVIFIALYFTLGALARDRPGVKTGTTHPTISRESCSDCHAEIAAEWRESFHFRSLSGPFWQRIRSKGYEPLFKILRIPCVNCHAPANVLDLPNGAHPVERTDAARNGVDCVSCHVSERGILGPGLSTQAPHEVIGDERFRDPMLASKTICASCHEEEVSHAKTVTAWLATPFARDRVSCVDCHMPMIQSKPDAGTPQRFRRSHRFLADKNVEMLRRALNATIDLSGEGTAVVRIVNDRVGHSLPAGGTNSLIARVTVQDRQGTTVHEEEQAFGTKESLPGYLDFWPFLQVTKIAYGESRNIQVRLPEGHGRVSAEFRYRDWFTVTNRDITIATITREF
jgi:nitrate/TMAO reductase-like tetraheme cytochrome c subunit